MDPTSIIGYTSDKNVAGYSSNDFLWSSPGITDPTGGNCSTTYADITLCTPDTTSNDKPTINDCYKQSYCDNQTKSNSILAMQSVHTGADGRFSDTKNKYNMQLLSTINLGVGIIGIGVFIFYNH
jgi:hypothetical protein